jgi:GNAT superfamily N-acetyltransferase
MDKAENRIISKIEKANWAEAHSVVKHLYQDIELLPFLENLEEMSLKGYSMIGLWINGNLYSIAGVQVIQYLCSGNVLWIVDMVTVPEQRSKGYGKLLLDYIHNYAKDMGYSRVLLHTAHFRCEAIHFYNRYFGNSFGLIYRSVINNL